jgi:uncharacterized protein with von Willebrand factor type A (vWA) domain
MGDSPAGEGSSAQPPIPPYLGQLVQRLRRRGFVLGADDYSALQQALRCGFGLASREDLRDLCSTLWAKSRQDKEVLFALFDQEVPADVDWAVSLPSGGEVSPEGSEEAEVIEEPRHEEPSQQAEVPAQARSQGALPPVSLSGVQVAERRFIFVPQFPLTYRQVTQAWRRLRRPVRMGPATELDVEGTVARRAQTGIATPVVLRPRRRNLARLLLLVDREGSMVPFHRFSDEVCAAIQEAGRLADAALYFFHDAPAAGADEAVLEPLHNQHFPVLDTILPDIAPLSAGYVYDDRNLVSPQSLQEVLEKYAADAAVILLSDGGAARGRLDMLRLLDTLAFVKALRGYTSRYVWLNPLPKRYWAQSTAEHLQRHIPMFALDAQGLNQAVDVLRGHPTSVEKPV